MAKKETYGDMIENLHGIIDELENEELSLEDSMKRYEDGVKLINKLYKTLNGLEGKITKIKDNVEVEFEGKNEN